MPGLRNAFSLQIRCFAVLITSALVITGSVSEAEAGVPCAATSGREMKIGGTACSSADALFSWHGNRGTIDIYVTVRDCASQPVGGSDVQLGFVVAGDPTDEFAASAEMRINVDSELNGTTDAAGVALFEVLVGGCGQVQIDWTATADGVELGTDSQSYCVRAFDMNGSGEVNFYDTFLCLPQYFTGVGWAADFSCVAPINFFDLFHYLPDLNSAAKAEVSMAATPAILGECAP